jgi:hypothetical protein
MNFTLGDRGPLEKGVSAKLSKYIKIYKLNLFYSLLMLTHLGGCSCQEPATKPRKDCSATMNTTLMKFQAQVRDQIITKKLIN